MVNIKVHRSIMVKPAEPTPNDSTVISDCDQEKPMTHIPTVYFYRSLEPPFTFASASQTLQDSLSQLLVHFYPIAGRLHMVEGGRVALDCNAAGVMFYEAESDASIEDFKDFAPTQELRALSPSVDYSGDLNELPLLLVQLTKLSCGGICLGLGFSHIMEDGVGASHFIAEWANIARCGSIQNPPFLDRSILLGSTARPPAPARIREDKFGPLPLIKGQADNQAERVKETTMAMLNLSKSQLERLKEMANENRDMNVRAYSRFEALGAHIWKCASKAREHDPDQRTSVGVVIDFRNRIPFPKYYCGNAHVRVPATSTSGELINKPLAYASSKIREVIEAVDQDYVKYSLDLVKGQPDLTKFRTLHKVGATQGPFLGNPNLVFTSWLGIPLRGTDFGWGKEIYFGPGVLNSDGKCFILPGYAEEGSVCLAIRLQVSHMENFKKYFYEDISVQSNKTNQSTGIEMSNEVFDAKQVSPKYMDRADLRSAPNDVIEIVDRGY